MSSNITEVAVRISEELAQPLIVSSLHGERFVSESLNRKMSGVFDAGVISGFEPELAGGMVVRVTSKSAKKAIGAALVDNSDLTAVTVRQLSDVQVTIPAGGVSIVVVEAIYGNIKTRQVDANSNTDAAVVKAVYSKTDTQIELFRVNAPAGTEELTLEMIDTSQRQHSSANPGFAESLDDDPHKLISLELLNALIASGELGGGSGSFYVPEIIPVTADSDKLTYQLAYPVGFLVVNAEFQRPGAAYDYTVDEKTKTITFLSGSVEAGDTVSIYHEVVKSNPNAKATQSIIWPYNGGLPVAAGVNGFYLPFKAASVSMINVSGSMQYNGVNFDYYPDDQLVLLKDSEMEGGEVVIIHTELKAIDALMPEAIRGYDFDDGGRVYSINDHVFNAANQSWYYWSGEFPHSFAAGAGPTAGWEFAGGDAMLRKNLAEKGTDGVGPINLSMAVGLGLIGWRRKKFSVLSEATAERALNDTKVKLHEFASYVTDKPDANDPNTWDWAPALTAAAAYIALYQEWKLSTTTRWSSVGLVVTPGAYPIRSKVVINYENISGAVTGKPIFAMEMDGAIFISEVANDYMVEFHGIELYLVRPKATMGAGKYGYLFKFGNENELTNHGNAVTGTIIRPWASGFTKNLVYGWGFDQIIINPYFTSMKQDPLITDIPATCFEVKRHVMDNCNNITVIRCQYETTTTTNYEAIRIEGNSTSSAHHNIHHLNSHVEPHIRGGKAIAVYSNGNTALATATFSGVFTENGENVFPAASTNFVLLENPMGVTFAAGTHIVTNNKMPKVNDQDVPYDPAVHKSVIKITGNSPTTKFDGVYFTTAFTTIAASASDMRAAIDTTGHNAGEWAVTYEGALNDHRRLVSNKGPVYTGTGANGNRRIGVKNDVDGRKLSWNYTSDVYGTAGTWSEIFSVDYLGVASAVKFKATYFEGITLRLGYGTGTASNRGVEIYTDGSSGDTAPVRFVGSAAGTATIISAGTITIAANGGASAVRFTGNLVPTATGYNLATTSIPVNNGYFQNSPIVVSDERLKQGQRELNDAELECAKACAKLYRVYKLNAAVEEKGFDEARYHVGILAQDVMKCFTDNGLDWTLYGIVTYESWDKTELEDGETVSEDGSSVLDSQGEMIRQYHAAGGDRYMVRYDEFNSFVNIGIAARLDEIESKLLAA